MIKYVLAILVLIAALAGLLLYVGDDATLTLTSSAEAGPLMMAPIVLSWQAVIVVFTGFVLAVVCLWSLLTWVWSLPARIKSGVGLRRRNQALEAMEEALYAGADGDASKARKKAERARNLINSADLGRIVSAQAAEASGDKAEAVAQYTAMLDSKKTRATGQHGLARNLLAGGDLVGAMEQAQIAYADSKNARWAFDVLFQAQMADYQWMSASETLDKGEGRKHIDKEVARRRRAVLFSAEADRIKEDGQTEKAMELAVQAAKSCPEFSPAVALATTLLKSAGQHKKAITLIEKAWARQPHPALALALQDLIAGETDRVRSKRIASLIKTNPTHKESHMVSAEEKLRQGAGVAALSELAPYLNLDSETEPPTARLCQLAGQIEETLGNQSDARLWYERAATAPLDPDWSDLDPEGEAFEYSDADWRRLTFSFGDTGTLIHPRYEAGASRRRAGMAAVPLAAVAAEAAPKGLPEPEQSDAEISDADDVTHDVDEATAEDVSDDIEIIDDEIELEVVDDAAADTQKSVASAADETVIYADELEKADDTKVEDTVEVVSPVEAPKKDYGEVVAESAQANKEELSKRLDNLMDKPKAELTDTDISEAEVLSLETAESVASDAETVIVESVKDELSSVEAPITTAQDTLGDTSKSLSDVETPKGDMSKTEAPIPKDDTAKVEVTKIEKPLMSRLSLGRKKK